MHWLIAVWILFAGFDVTWASSSVQITQTKKNPRQLPPRVLKGFVSSILILFIYLRLWNVVLLQSAVFWGFFYSLQFVKRHFSLCDLLNSLSFCRMKKKMKPMSRHSDIYVLGKKTRYSIFMSCTWCAKKDLDNVYTAAYFLPIFIWRISIFYWQMFSPWLKRLSPTSFPVQPTGRPCKCQNACLWCMVT